MLTLTIASFTLVLHSDKYAPTGEYIHHFPHFDNPHNFHVPGFNATLALYKEVHFRFCVRFIRCSWTFFVNYILFIC